MWIIYVLVCGDGSLYTGITDNLEKRISDHNLGKGGRYTRSHLPVKLVYQEKSDNRSNALKREAGIKSWRREKKIKDLKLVLSNIR